MKKKYDLHTHTNVSSCAGQSAKDLLDSAYRKGLAGLAVTDHNSIQGGVNVFKLNRRDDFEVIVGSEIQTMDGGEILAFFLNENIKSGPALEVKDEIRAQGGIFSLAHPFDPLRAHFSKDLIKELSPDAIEVRNGRMIPSFLELSARSIARDVGASFTGGSDAHFSFEVGRVWTEFEGDLRKSILKGKTKAKGAVWPHPFGLPRTLIKKIKQF